MICVDCRTKVLNTTMLGHDIMSQVLPERREVLVSLPVFQTAGIVQEAPGPSSNSCDYVLRRFVSTFSAFIA